LIARAILSFGAAQPASPQAENESGLLLYNASGANLFFKRTAVTDV